MASGDGGEREDHGGANEGGGATSSTDEARAQEVQEAVGQAPGEEEAVARRQLPTPEMPTASEVSHHKTTHCPYRSWCDECVEAFGCEWPHHAGGARHARSIPVIHMDYAFLTDKGMTKRSGLSEEEVRKALKVLVVYDSFSRGPSAYAVYTKGANDDGFAAARICESIEYAGHTGDPAQRHRAGSAGCRQGRPEGATSQGARQCRFGGVCAVRPSDGRSG